MRRAVGDFSALAASDNFASLIGECPKDRKFYVYIRKSNAVAEAANANYLMAQYDIYRRLLDLGIPDSQIVKLTDDTGKSGALSRQFRTDLARTYDDMGDHIVGTVLIIDISRLYRDETERGPAEFASRAKVHDMCIVTQIDSRWTLLRMAEDSDNRRFRELARAAADDRKVIRARTIAAREGSVLEGGYSGAPCPFGWAVHPKQTRFESEDDKEHAAYLYVYEPHAEIKKEIMRLSLRPEIKTLRGLRDLLVKRNIKITPFDLEVAKDSFSRSLLCRARTSEGGVSRSIKKTDAFIPSKKIIHGILVEPLAVGDRLYGSGKYGEWKARRLEKQALQEDRTSDHMLRTNREYIDTRPELAICKTDEEVEMYFHVCEKWSYVDVKAAREARYETEPKNPECVRKVGRAVGSGHKQFNEWAGIAFCGKHGRDEENGFAHTHYLRRHPKRGEWACSKSLDAGEAEHSCTAWSDGDRLGRILDFHLFYFLDGMLRSDTSLLDDVADERDSLAKRVEALRVEISQVHAERKRQLRRQDDYERRLEQSGADEGFVRRETDAFYNEHVASVLAKLAKTEKELSIAEEEQMNQLSVGTEAELRDGLLSAVAAPLNLSNDKKRELVLAFVDSVEVIVPEHTGECLIFFTWSRAVRDGRGEQARDVLITSKSLARDTRPFTPEEDDALRQLYPREAGASYEELKVRLQAGRKIDNIIRRASELGIKRPMRSKEWIEECRRSEKTWSQDHPDVFYLWLRGTQFGYVDHLLDHDAEGSPSWPIEADEVALGKSVPETIELPDQIREGIQMHRQYLQFRTTDVSSCRLRGDGQLKKTNLQQIQFLLLRLCSSC